MSAGVSGFSVSFFLDRFERKRTLLTLLCFYVFGLFATASAPSFHFLLAARALTGMFGGLLAAVLFSIIGDAVSPHRRGDATGKVLAAFPVSSVITVPGGLILANTFSWRMPFYGFTCMAVLALITASKTVPQLRGHLKSKPPSIQEKARILLGNRNHVNCYIMMVMQMFAGFTVISFTYLVGNVGFLETDIPTMYFVGGLFTIFTTPFIGKMVDRYGVHKVYRTVAALSIIPIVGYESAARQFLVCSVCRRYL